MRLPGFTRSRDDRVVAGVCAGIARMLGVDATLVRLVFVLLALAGGAGVLLYLALLVHGSDRSPWVAAVFGLLGVSLLLHALGLGDRVVAGIALVAGGLFLIWRRRGGVAGSSFVVGIALAGAGADVEELYGVRVELTSSGDCPADERTEAIVLAAREAMTNAAKYSRAEEVDVYAESGEESVSVFVRDRGVGFDPSAVPSGRRGIAESIVGRMARAGGEAMVTSSPGGGAEIELRLPRGPA